MQKDCRSIAAVLFYHSAFGLFGTKKLSANLVVRSGKGYNKKNGNLTEKEE